MPGCDVPLALAPRAQPLHVARCTLHAARCYRHDKVVALFCDDQLFVKPTVGGKAFIGKVKEAPPYPGAKPCYLISGDRCEDGEWLSELILITEREMPPPRPKASKARSAKTKPSKANDRRPSRR